MINKFIIVLLGTFILVNLSFSDDSTHELLGCKWNLPKYFKTSPYNSDTYFSYTSNTNDKEYAQVIFYK